MNVEEITLDEKQQQIIEGKRFPKVLEATGNPSLEDAIEWVKENKQSLENDLQNHGAFIVRNFPIHKIQEFHDFLISFGWNHDVQYTG